MGDIESLPFLEAIRQFRSDVGRDNVCYIHIALVPYVATAGELKTKPVQHSVKELRTVGISPDVILCRTDRFLSKALKAKISLFCNVDDDAVITAKDVDVIYEVPLILHKEGLDEKITQLLNIWTGRPDLRPWEDVVQRAKNPESELTIGMVGKYVELTESYKSLNEALYHGGFANRAGVKVEYFDSEKLDDPPPVSARESTSWFDASASISTKPTFDPWAQNCLTVSAPIPEAPPVMNTVLPARSMPSSTSSVDVSCPNVMSSPLQGTLVGRAELRRQIEHHQQPPETDVLAGHHAKLQNFGVIELRTQPVEKPVIYTVMIDSEQFRIFQRQSLPVRKSVFLAVELGDFLFRQAVFHRRWKSCA